MLIGSLPLEDTHKGLHEGVEAWHDLLENLRVHLTFVQQFSRLRKAYRASMACSFCEGRGSLNHGVHI